MLGNNFNKLIGAIFMITSGVLYTAERIAEKHAAALVAAGYAMDGRGGDRAAFYPHFFENFFVWFFLFVGFLMLASGFPRDKK